MMGKLVDGKVGKVQTMGTLRRGEVLECWDCWDDGKVGIIERL